MVDNKKTYGIIAILSMLLGFGGNMIISDDNTYVCTTNENIGVFERLSSTQKTGYWTENGTEQSSVCRNGYWITIKEYAKNQGINLNEQTTNTIEYECGFNECVRK